MQVVSALVEFLMGLMSDEEARTAFQSDPEATLALHNLHGVTGQDVRDARLVMTDGGGLRCTSGEWSSSTHHDAVREIQHTTRHYEVHDQTFNLVSIDDRDTLINDSFNDSFNSDDDGVDTDTTNVVAIQDNDQIDNRVSDDEVVRLDRPDSNPGSNPDENTAQDVADTGPEDTDEPVVEEDPLAAIPDPVEPEPLPDEPEFEDHPDLDAGLG